ncbi:MAG: hypothetical protein KDD70_04140 [Bdellovibrionales bacterium]|nr:hypothetical protein [Bdellovibrionales bacterium]
MRTRELYFNEAGCELEERRKRLFHDFPHARIRRVYDWGVLLESVPLKRVSEPPTGYGYKGGAARLALTHALGIEESYRAARDIDLIRITASVDAIDRAVAQKFMEEDVKHGNGVEGVRDFQEYLVTRDITVNEVLYLQDRVIASYDAIQDCKNRALRPTRFALTQEQDSRNRISAKIIRFAAEAILAGNPPSSVTLASDEPLTQFNFLLQLDRALSGGGRLAETYFREVASRGLLPNSFSTITTLEKLSGALKKLSKKELKPFPKVSALSGSKQTLPAKKKLRMG